MKEGDIILTPIPQVNGQLKNRHALFLCELPWFRDMLVCGISTRIHQAVEGLNEIIIKTDSVYVLSGLIVARDG